MRVILFAFLESLSHHDQMGPTLLCMQNLLLVSVGSTALRSQLFQLLSSRRQGRRLLDFSHRRIVVTIPIVPVLVIVGSQDFFAIWVGRVQFDVLARCIVDRPSDLFQKVVIYNKQKGKKTS